jgi:hypothetical protein
MELSKPNNSQDLTLAGKINSIIQKPIKYALNEVAEKDIQFEVMSSIRKCAIGLGIQMSDIALQTLAEDIISVYTYESLESITEVLRNARRGLYQFGHNPRSALTMILIREWMSIYLDDKAMKRRIEEKKKEMEETYKTVDPEQALERIKKIRDLIVVKTTEIKSVGITKNDFIDKLKQDLPNSTPEMIESFLSELQKNPERWKEEIELINKYLKK